MFISVKKLKWVLLLRTINYMIAMESHENKDSYIENSFHLSKITLSHPEDKFCLQEQFTLIIKEICKILNF